MVGVWELTSFALRQTLVHSEAVVKLKWRAGEPLLVTCTADGGLHTWDARDGRSVGVQTGHAGLIVDFALKEGVGGKPGFVWTAGDDGVARRFPLLGGR